MRLIGLIVLFIVAAFLMWQAYKYFFNDTSVVSEEGPTIQSDPRPVGPNVNVLADEESTKGSVLINFSNISAAQSPSSYFNNLNDKNVSSYNVLTYPTPSPPLIHYTTSFGGNCHNYVWYQRSLYALVSSKTDDNGNKTCYYKFDKSIFPNQIKVLSTVVSDNCSAFKYYISGIEYRFDKQNTENLGFGMVKKYCIYKKK